MSPIAGAERSRGSFGLLVRIAVAIALTAFILWYSNPSEVVESIRHARWTPVLVAVLLVFVDRSLMAYRWVALLGTLDNGRRPPMPALLRIFFVSTFVGSFLPASVGADAVRSYSLSRLSVPGSDAVASVFMDRMLGFASLLLMALAGLGLARQLAAQTAVLLGIAVTAALCVLTILLVFDTRTAAAASGVIRRVPSDTARRMGISLLESVRKYAAHPGTLVTVLIGSVGVQVLRVLQAFFLGRSLDIAAPLAIYFAFLPLILIVMLVPVTINGIGTSQAAFVWFFSQAQVPEAASFALSVLFVALGLVGNLPGALLYVTGKRGD